jgi:glycosyltransferase involved in cell wall biosynthesis
MGRTFWALLVEAMACGTPVIAFKRGSIPEVVKNGKTGFIVKNEKEA